MSLPWMSYSVGGDALQRPPLSNSPLDKWGEGTLCSPKLGKQKLFGWWSERYSSSKPYNQFLLNVVSCDNTTILQSGYFATADGSLKLAACQMNDRNPCSG